MAREHRSHQEQVIHSHLEQAIRNRQEHRRARGHQGRRKAREHHSHRERENHIHRGHHRSHEIHQKAATRREDENREEGEGERAAPEEPPTGCGRWPAQRNTIAGSSDRTGQSNLEAEEDDRKEVGSRAEEEEHRMAVEEQASRIAEERANRNPEEGENHRSSEGEELRIVAEEEEMRSPGEEEHRSLEEQESRSPEGELRIRYRRRHGCYPEPAEELPLPSSCHRTQGSQTPG